MSRSIAGLGRRLNPSAIAAFGAGLALSGVALAPKDTVNGDLYMRWAICGLVLMALAIVLRWLLTVRAVHEQRRENLEQVRGAKER